MSEAQEIFARYRQAMLDLDADALADLYSDEAVHEFPLFSPFFPKVLKGREDIRKHYAAVWSAGLMRMIEVREVAVYATAVPDVAIAEGQYTAESVEGGRRFDLSFIVVMRLEAGRIAHLRDYMDSLGAAVGLDRVAALAARLAPRT
jgi:uncharacterized protein